MLQQTQVSRVVPKYHMFLERFPNPTLCAKSNPGEIIELWSGLGYNRRAINLYRAAEIIADKHQGIVPNELSILLDLPGIGDYTARAILAFSYEQNVAVVDVNVKRVLSRLEGRTLSMNETQSIADQNLPKGEGWRWNQAMIEIGATICTARKLNAVTVRSGKPVPGRETKQRPTLLTQLRGKSSRPLKVLTDKVEVN